MTPGCQYIHHQSEDYGLDSSDGLHSCRIGQHQAIKGTARKWKSLCTAFTIPLFSVWRNSSSEHQDECPAHAGPLRLCHGSVGLQRQWDSVLNDYLHADSEHNYHWLRSLIMMYKVFCYECHMHCVMIVLSSLGTSDRKDLFIISTSCCVRRFSRLLVWAPSWDFQVGCCWSLVSHLGRTVHFHVKYLLRCTFKFSSLVGEMHGQLMSVVATLRVILPANLQLCGGERGWAIGRDNWAVTLVNRSWWKLMGVQLISVVA